MRVVKAPKTLYLKDCEQENIEVIANIRNLERTEKGKKELNVSNYIHEIIEKGINDELERLRLPKNGVEHRDPNSSLQKLEKLGVKF